MKDTRGSGRSELVTVTLKFVTVTELRRPTNSDFSRKPTHLLRKPVLQMASFNSFIDMSMGLLSNQRVAAAASAAEVLVMVDDQ